MGKETEKTEFSLKKNRKKTDFFMYTGVANGLGLNAIVQSMQKSIHKTTVLRSSGTPILKPCMQSLTERHVTQKLYRVHTSCLHFFSLTFTDFCT